MLIKIHHNYWPWLYVSWSWLKYLPQPRWAQSSYYKISFILWGHPSNYHWKRGPFGCSCIIGPGRRCLWCGVYQTIYYIEDPIKRKEYLETISKGEHEAWKNLQWRRKPLRWWDNLKWAFTIGKLNKLGKPHLT